MTRFSLLLAAVLLAQIAVPRASGQQTGRETLEQRLGERYANAAMTMLRVEPLTPQALHTAARLMELATSLDSSDAELWRLTLKIADLAEMDDLQDKAVRAIIRLDPADDVARLRRIRQIVEDAQTVDERVKVYERLLEPKRMEQLGNAVASRVAFDYALLLRREGRVSAFTEQLAKAVDLDPANRAAASLATGFFQSNVDDPYGEAELLMNLFLADPTTIDVQGALAQLAIGTGAYDAAARLYELLTNSSAAKGSRVPANLVADHAIALWGAGREQRALALIEQQQILMNQIERHRAMQEGDDTMPLDVAELDATLTPIIATVRAAILNRQNDPHARQAAELALQSYDESIAKYKQQVQQQAKQNPQGQAAQVDPKLIARSHLEQAWIAVWLHGDADRAVQYLDQAGAIEPLSDAARTRFDGWIALRRNEVDRAIELLGSVEDDDAARIGLAVAYLQQDRKRDAAGQLLQVARNQPGTLMGVWASDRLYELVGQRVPISDLARRLNELINTLPPYIDRFPQRPSELFSVRVHPAETTFGPFDPVVFNVELSNNARFPLAISPHGPIRPQIAMIPTARAVQRTRMPTLEPIVIDIDQRLRLEPKERVTIPVDLRRYNVGSLLESYMILGSFVRVRVIWNFRLSPSDTLEPGLLGDELETMFLRVEGARVDGAWINRMLDNIRVVDRPSDVNDLIMLTHVTNTLASDISQEDVERIDKEMRSTLADAYNQLEPAHQALVLSEIALSPFVEQLLEQARTSDNELVQLAFLLNCVQSGDDPMIAAGKRSEHPLVQLVATQLEQVAQIRAARQRMQEQQQQQQQQQGNPR